MSQPSPAALTSTYMRQISLILVAAVIATLVNMPFGGVDYIGRRWKQATVGKARIEHYVLPALN